jgi:uncharacterized repeat protein (TIGR01451 family)
MLESLEDRTTPSTLGLSLTGPASATAGNTITYNVQLSNPGPDATGVRVVVGVPSGEVVDPNATGQNDFNLFGSSDTFSGPIITNNPDGSSTVEFDAPTVLAGNVDHFGIVARVSPGTTPGTLFTGTGSVTNNDPFSPITVAAPVQTNVNGSLSLTETGTPSSVAPGGNLTYTVALTNVGIAQATNVILTDTLPAGETLVGTPMQIGGSDPFVNNSNGNRVEFDTLSINGTPLGVAPGNTDTFQFVVSQTPAVAPGTTLVNQAAVSSVVNSTPDTSTSNTVLTTVPSTTTNPDPSSPSSPSCSFSGDQFTALVRLFNDGIALEQAMLHGASTASVQADINCVLPAAGPFGEFFLEFGELEGQFV